MKLSTSTNLVFERPDHTIFPMTEMMKIAKTAGFQEFDLNFYDWSLPHSPFLTDKWRSWIEEIAEEKERLGVSFGQCHAYTYNFLDPCMTSEEKERHEMLVLRSLECSAIVGATVCVTHPDTDFTAISQGKCSKEKNLEYFKRLIEKAGAFEMELAIENMCDITIAPRRKYCAYPEELADLLDTLSDKRIGACWDFEHADIMQQNQRQSLLLLKDHLKATHVSDTHSATDPDLMHVMPSFGKIDWKEAVETLKEINYQGSFSFEVNNYGNYFPDELLPTALEFAYKIGQYLMELGDK